MGRTESAVRVSVIFFKSPPVSVLWQRKGGGGYDLVGFIRGGELDLLPCVIYRKYELRKSSV